MSHFAKTIPGHKLSMTPESCSEQYAEGWEYADWYISNGGDLNGDAPGQWSEEKANGFWDRLAEERKLRVAR